MPILRFPFLRAIAALTTRPGMRRGESAPKCFSRPSLEALEDRYVLSTLTVTSSADDITQRGTLRYAIAHADNGDKILITSAIHGTPIVLTQGELLLNKDLTIEAVGNAPATISGNNVSRVFEIASNAHVTLSSLTITHGYSNGLVGGIYVFGEGGAILNSGMSAINNCTLQENTATFGGGICNSGTLTVTNSTIHGNKGVGGIEDGSGGGIYNGYGSVAITDSTLSGNFADNGGGILNAAGTLMITGSILSDNSAYHGPTGSGGGILNFGILMITGSILSHNSAYLFGGGIDNGDNNGHVTINHSSLSGNSALFGGGISNEGGSVNISYSALFGNSANYGGGIANSSGWTVPVGGPVIVSNSHIFGNSAAYGGGGIYNYFGALTVSNSTILGNTAQAGADLFMAGGTLMNNNSVIGIISP